MLTTRIARIAEQDGAQAFPACGKAMLGLFKTVQCDTPIHFAVSNRAFTGLVELGILEDKSERSEVANLLNRKDVWIRFGCRKNGKPSLLLPGMSEFEELVNNGLWEGIEISLRVLGVQLNCVVPDTHDTLLITSARRSGRLPWHVEDAERLLVGTFVVGHNKEFDLSSIVQVVVTHIREGESKICAEAQKAETAARKFLNPIRSILDLKRKYMESVKPVAEFAVTGREPIQLEQPSGESWPQAFAMPHCRVVLRDSNGLELQGMVAEATDQQEYLLIEPAPWANSSELADSGEIEVVPNTASIQRCREAIDSILISGHRAHMVLVDALVKPGSLPQLPEPKPHSSKTRQDEAVQLALGTPDIALIQGPPGTGKTTVICRIVEALIRSGNRILMVAPTHVALDNVLERVGDASGVYSIRLGHSKNVDPLAHEYMLPNLSRTLRARLIDDLERGANCKTRNDLAPLQRELSTRIQSTDGIGEMLLLNANLVCATPIGIAMNREFRNVEPSFDVMIIDEASKATIADFLVPASRAKKWILVGDHLQLPPYLDTAEVSFAIAERVERSGLPDVPKDWVEQLTVRLQRVFEFRMHPNADVRSKVWDAFISCLCAELDETTQDALKAAPDDASAFAKLRKGPQRDSPRDRILRLGRELMQLKDTALPSVFEHLDKLPADRKIRLNTQYRMAPELAAFSAECVYAGDYPSAPSTAGLGLAIPSLEDHSIWLDTSQATFDKQYEHPRPSNSTPRSMQWRGGGYFNKFEEEIALEVVENCVDWATANWAGTNVKDAGRAFEIGVVCFYLKQARNLRDSLFSKFRSQGTGWRRDLDIRAAGGQPINVHICTVDRIQGQEKDVVVLCTTRSNDMSIRGHVNNLNRLNVAVTRARHKRIIIGNSSTLANSRFRAPKVEGDLLVALLESCVVKTKWGRVMGRAHERR